MHLVHGFACAEVARSGRAPPELVQVHLGHATALKPTHKAGRRGGDSTARFVGRNETFCLLACIAKA